MSNSRREYKWPAREPCSALSMARDAISRRSFQVHHSEDSVRSGLSLTASMVDIGQSGIHTSCGLRASNATAVAGEHKSVEPTTRPILKAGEWWFHVQLCSNIGRLAGWHG